MASWTRPLTAWRTCQLVDLLKMFFQFFLDRFDGSCVRPNPVRLHHGDVTFIEVCAHAKPASRRETAVTLPFQGRSPAQPERSCSTPLF